ncbi:MarR family protein [Amycolatopsis xylanica]|uniref:MarR family protein n=1 Tax=Amycolatopsis xylanica TaxID=589385 RepID=A0A1H2S9F5_9PSEU|nr:helix-turn-helix domain-containing protein [Amycolatopsis xylanica]SDW27764.1 MarR family protein [Amycolatopsis xylanica]
MPGGRLTRQDRQLIATGLARGLSFNEIAKSLARPTSTITREVARNGGPNAYQAHRAQQATTRRARRANQAGPPEPIADDTGGRDPETVRRLEARFTEMLVQAGLPRMPTRVLASLYTTDTGSLTAADLARRLRVSPASVSKAVAYLEDQQLIRREHDERRDRYVLDDDLWYRSMLASAERNATLAAASREASEALGAETPAGIRLGKAAEFLQQLNHDIVEAAKRHHLLER